MFCLYKLKCSRLSNFLSICFKIVIFMLQRFLKVFISLLKMCKLSAKICLLICTCFIIIINNYDYFQGNNISYQDQALFSFVFWPFSLKLIWAPIVDGAYFKSIGRRKSWLMPSQLTIALVMYALSTK